MKSSELKKFRKEMEKILEPKRFEHTLGVAYTAANLAMVHGANVDHALIAGMLHDCAKCMSFHKQLAVCEKAHMPLSEMERDKESPLLHAKAGSILAWKKYGVKNEDIRNAICYHTTGRPDMSLLEKVIYIADYIEPGRGLTHRSSSKYTEDLAVVRKLAYQDIDAALRRILSDSLSYLQQKGGRVDPMTQETFAFYTGGIYGRK